uniref:Disease resistance protein RPM1 n=1 Tax=Aegilops tauschii TaxID=37682 RepID=M8BM27_AEGTA
MDAQGALNSLLGRLTAILVDEAKLLGGLHGDVEFIKDEMESMNGLLLHLTEAHHRDHQAPHGSEDKDKNIGRHALLLNCESLGAYEQKIMDDTIKSLLLFEEGPVEELADVESKPKIFLMTWDEYKKTDGMSRVDLDFTNHVARKMYEDKMSSFCCKALVKAYTAGERYKPQKFKPLDQLLREILAQVEADKCMETSQGDEEEDEAMQLTKKLEGYLKGKQFLIILQDVISTEYWDVHDKEKWNSIWSALLHATAHGSPGSAIVITTKSDHLAVSPNKKFKPQSTFGVFYSKTMKLASCSGDSAYWIAQILELCYPDVFAMRMFQHLLYVNPGRGKIQLEKFRSTLNRCRDSNKSVAKQMVQISYNDLPAKYRSCLLYLTIFLEGDRIRTTVCRRWIAEGLITSRDNHAEHEANCCFDALLSRGLMQPGEISDMGRIKTCTLHPVVREVITRIARDLNFVDTDLPPDLARHLSIHSSTGVQTSQADNSVQAADGKGIVAFVPYLAKSSQWQLMKMLDLEGCTGLKKHHLKSICKIILLKYLSLRNTDITELPKQIEKLQCLETLDIRQTAVKEFATRSIILPMLKHLLSGQAESSSNNSDRSQKSFKAVHLPSSIKRMEQLETLSYVEAYHSVHDFSDVGHLSRLTKLGVVLRGKAGLGVLFQQIEKLHGCLRSLSIQINQPHKVEDALTLASLFQQIEKLHGFLRFLSIQNNQLPKVEDTLTLASPPKLLQSLKISGIRSELLNWIAELDQLSSITLSQTCLGEEYICILGKLTALRCLRLWRNSYAGSGLTFKDGEFENLKYLVIDDYVITNITFDTGAAPMLETIIWSFAKMESISGVLCLPKLMKLELNGDCDPDLVTQVFKEVPYHIDFKHKPFHGHQEDGA